MSDTRNVFVLGMNAFHRDLLTSMPQADRLRFHPLFPEQHELIYQQRLEPMRYLDDVRAELDSFDGSIDAIVAVWDFPTTLMAGVLRSEYGCPGATLEMLLTCEHKYWSRVLQRSCTPEVTPEFELIDPFDAPPWPQIAHHVPFWLKPIKSWSSQLAFRIRTREQYFEALELTRASVRRIGQAFDAFLAIADIPDWVGQAHGSHCLIEQDVHGEQFTVEGVVHNRQVTLLGVIDSIHVPDGTSFARYQIPSRAPERLCQAMTQSAESLILGCGLDDSGFNIEYFYDEELDQVWILEVNPRVSQSHSSMFRRAGGLTNLAPVVDVALGDAPRWTRASGESRVASKFFLRVGTDGWVRHVPSDEQIAQIEARTGAHIELVVEEGMRLSSVFGNDPHSFVLAEIDVGARSEEDMLETYSDIVDALDMTIETSAHEQLPVSEHPEGAGAVQ